MCERMLTQWEQDVAETYVNEHHLDRTTTNILRSLVSFLMFAIFTGVIVWLIYFVAIDLGILSHMPLNIQRFYIMHPLLSEAIILLTVITIELCFCFKYALIGAIKLYQHYAPEEMRRRCLFMPTCSEYAILAVHKYGLIIGLCKSYYRLVYRCRGNIYQIDYP